MAEKIRVVQFGCGPIGCSIVRLAVAKGYLDIRGAVDLKGVGRDLGEVAHLERSLGVKIFDDAVSLLNKIKPDIVLHATSSSLKGIFPQLEVIIEAGANLISTSEELAFPYREQPELASAVDRLARKHQVTVLGTGVNPGFAMDTWPLVMTAVCGEVKNIRVVRFQDASQRRGPFQKKIGAGTTVEEFKKLAKAGTIRHVGLPESVAMMADCLGWKLDDITESIDPIIAQSEVRSGLLTVERGKVAGVKQLAHGWRDGEKLITLDFQAFIGAGESHDTVYITGDPNIEATVKGGIHGDTATAAVVVNSIKRVMKAPPGLLTMKDLPIVTAFR